MIHGFQRKSEDFWFGRNGGLRRFCRHQIRIRGQRLNNMIFYSSESNFDPIFEPDFTTVARKNPLMVPSCFSPNFTRQ